MEETALPKEPAPKPNHKTASGLDQNVAALLCYLFTWVSGVIFLLIEKDNKFVRFHAMQSLITFLGLMVISMVPFIGWAAGIIIAPLSFILWIVLMVKAFQGEKYKLPIVGDLAEKYTAK
jgi:uncharacterized membrane protein